MSSIYKKGRDGYYYYQAYVYNSETGKKDKKIYHSLKTKSRDIAYKKKVEFDAIYEDIAQPNKIQNGGRKYRKYINVLISCAIVGIVYNVISISRINDRNKVLKSKIGLKNHELIVIDNDDVNPDNIDLSTVEIEHIVESDALIRTGNYDEDLISSQNLSHSYNVERIQILSKSFGQSKIFLTVDKKLSSEEIRQLCKLLVDDYNEFSSFIICVYSDSNIGRSLANGGYMNYGDPEQRDAWLAMYTYNPVEGEFFDDNPGQYLGGN